MKQEVLRHIPIGTPIQEAKAIMERNSFLCGDFKNGEFYAEELGTVIKGDFFSCGASRSYFLALQSWGVIFLYKENKVTMVYAVVHWNNL